MTEEQITAIVDALGGLLDVLRRADPRHEAELYIRIGLRMTDHRARNTEGRGRL